MPPPHPPHGLPLLPREIERVLEMSMVYHLSIREEVPAPLPLCIWGPPGVGKTEIVKSFALRHGHSLAVVHPAQFEEMGDILGIPFREGNRTHWSPPVWVPTSPGPGILLLDDLNRADARILNGFMALFQEGRLASWSLPGQWMIVSTCNPQELNFAVTPMDEAIAGRMQHVFLDYHPESWFSWAREQISDLRALGFFRHYPEILDVHISPREATQFLRLLQHLPPGQTEDYRLLASSMLPPAFVHKFMTWMTLEGPDWLAPKAFLEEPDVRSRLESLQQRLQADQAMAAKLELMQRLRGLFREHPDQLTTTGLSNIIRLLEDPQVDGHMVLAFTHHFPSDSEIHTAVASSARLREKLV